MSIFNPNEVTRAGHALLHRSLSGQCRLHFTIVQAGDGHFDGDFMEITELVNHRLDGRVTDVREGGKFTEVDCHIDNSNLTSYMQFREVGLRATGIL